MSDPKQARVMLTLARNDLKALGGMADAESFENEIFGFHAQQAAEKGLKAWICLVGEEYPIAHDIRLLLAVLRKAGCGAEGFSGLVKYNAFAVRLRYELPRSPRVLLDRPATLGEVRQLIEHVEKMVEDAGAAT